MTACKNLLKEQFPTVGGLHSPILADNLAMEPQKGVFVQVLNVGRNHWVPISVHKTVSGYMTDGI